jgi:hypothetical protein
MWKVRLQNILESLVAGGLSARAGLSAGLCAGPIAGPMARLCAGMCDRSSARAGLGR